MEFKTMNGKTVLSISNEEYANLRQVREFMLSLYKGMNEKGFKSIASDYATTDDEEFANIVYVLDDLIDDYIPEDGLELI